MSLSIRLSGLHAAHLIKDGRRSHSRCITMPVDRRTDDRPRAAAGAFTHPVTPASLAPQQGPLERKKIQIGLALDASNAFVKIITTTDRQTNKQAGRREDLHA